MPLPPAIINILQNLGFGDQPQPQAMTRITHTPINWVPQENPNILAQYLPTKDRIEVNPARLPQNNPNMADLHSILTHEQVHAIMNGPMKNMVPSMSTLQMFKVLMQNPGQMAAMKKDLAPAGVPTSPLTLAGEGPAYAAQGYTFGDPGITQKYLNAMPASTKPMYQKLLDGTQGVSNPKQSE